MRFLAESLVTARTNPVRPYSNCALFPVLVLGLLPFLVGSSVGQTASAAVLPKASEVRAHTQRAEMALKENHPEAAAKEFRAILVLDPRNVEAHVDLGVIEMFQGNCQSAAPDFRQALKVQPSLTKAKALLGICSRRLGDSSAKSLLENSFPKLTDVRLRTQVGRTGLGMGRVSVFSISF